MNKRGLSGIVVTVLLILLVLAAVVLIWVFLRPFIFSSSEKLEPGLLTSNFRIISESVKLNETTKNANLVVNRNAGAGTIKAFNIILEDVNKKREVFRYNITLNELESTKINIDYSAADLEELQTISVAPIVLNKDGKELTASIQDTYKIRGTEGNINSGGGNPPPTLNIPTNGLVGYWKFDENTGTTAVDSSGNGNNGNVVFSYSVVVDQGGTAILSCPTSGTISSFTSTYGNNCGWGSCPIACGTCIIGSNFCSVTYESPSCSDCALYCRKSGYLSITCNSGYWVTGKVRNALIFNGVNSSVDIHNPSSLNINTGSIFAWIKTTNPGASYRGIVVKAGAYGIFLTDGILSSYDWSTNTQLSTGINLVDGNWHYVGYTFQSGIPNGAIIYVDGIPKLTTSMNIQNQNMGAIIGAGNNPPTIQFFNGTLDEVAIWNRSLSSQEIQDLYAYYTN